MFAEALPMECPPSKAVEQDWAEIYRLSFDSRPAEKHFKSYAALGKPVPRSLNDPCRWASCSLTTEPAMLKKLRSMRHPYAFKMSLPSSGGRSHADGIHVDFWRYAGFDVVSSVIDVEAI